MADEARRGKRGPKPIAGRKSQTFRLPEDHHAAYEEAARREGLPLGDYLARELALRHQFAVPEYIVRRQRRALATRSAQQELPISA
ncbi:hypothetical protein [Klenkia sp. PcliD-1-E]|jgi:hypothetical protein|uniref:hypothetical protein n=1 Tax=Klenkia sp. PcliD-1-E TaxID=2954492 RepID=UPI00209802BE|nr:hypothetical protein [Klenkia sp. PcliD-1-E]MCO7220851.1 hypothetical protein [Klenkia sp. PcliD-1-E]